MITEKKISEIKERETSQRNGFKGVENLVESIKRVGLIHPIVIDDSGMVIAGANRLEACRRLGWETIPVTLRSSMEYEDRKLLELDENCRRTDLMWQEKVRAIREMDGLILSKYPDMDANKRAEYIGVTRVTVSDAIMVADALDAGHEQVIAAGNLTSAVNILEREKRRRIDDDTNAMMAYLSDTNPIDMDEEVDEPEETKGKVEVREKKEKPLKRETSSIIQGDFHSFISSYEGKKFNLIHCDFPYGINHGQSGQGGAKTWGAYEDSENIYWDLLRSFAEHRDKFIYPSAHIIFWFSMRYYTETIRFFAEHMPEMSVDHQPLVWFKSDNKGIIRDPKHTYRNVTETALFITRGNRELVSPVANCYAAAKPSNSGIHVSEKPVEVIKHFFRGCCDQYSEVFDPTCGSGSAIRAADDFGVSRALGLEMNEEYAKAAQNSLKEHRGAREILSSIGGE